MANLEERLRAVADARRVAEEQAAERRYLDDSRTRLGRILRKKLTTSFIGAISAFEAHFGALWGHGLPAARCSEAQLQWRAVWEGCRNEVLNTGNAQHRAVENELGEYAVRWNRHVTNLPAAGGPPGVSSVSPATQDHQEG